MLGKVTLGLFFLLLVWGNMVAGMKAGMACPDWPLCHGRVLPPLRLDIYMEFTHRLIAAAATVALVALSYNRFKAYAGRARAVPVFAVCLVALEILLGGFVVLFGTPVQLTTVHFMIGLTAFMLVFYMMSFDGRRDPAGFSLRGPAAIFFLLALLVYSQAALGAYVRHSESGLSCPDFPTCLGNWLPPILDRHTLVHFSHRLAGVLILLTSFTVYAAARLDGRLGESRDAVMAFVFLMLGQIAVGAAVVLSRLYFLTTALHMAVALGLLYLLGSRWAYEVKKMEAAP